MRGQWQQRSPLIGAARCQGLGRRCHWGAAAPTPLSADPPRAEHSALFAPGGASVHSCRVEMGPSSLVLGPLPLGMAHHKGLSMEPLRALNRPRHILRRLQRGRAARPTPARHICTVVHKGQSWVGAGEPVGVGYNFPQQTPTVCAEGVLRRPALCICRNVFSLEL